jgi:hypothetical protein
MANAHGPLVRILVLRHEGFAILLLDPTLPVEVCMPPAHWDTYRNRLPCGGSSRHRDHWQCHRGQFAMHWHTTCGKGTPAGRACKAGQL